MGSLFRLTGDTVTPSAGTRVLKASEAAVLLEANAVLDAARERVADMERKAGEAYERRREEGYRDGVEEGRLEHAEKVMETVLSSVEYIEGIEATLVNVVAVAVRKVIGEIDENERIVRAEWFRQPLSPLAKDEDDIYLVIHDTKEQDTLAYPLGKRGIPGTKEIPLHKDFTPANCVAYAFALSPVNTRASVSKYTNIILE